MVGVFARHAASVALGIAMLAGAARARADHAPTFVVPSRPSFPVVINGRNAAWAVVEGDWGLYRAGHMAPTVIGGSPLIYAPHRPYFPTHGAPPVLGRNEVEPPPDRALPEPAENFSRVWSTQSDPLPIPADVPRQRVYIQNPDPEAPPQRLDDAPPIAPPIVVVPQRRRGP